MNSSTALRLSLGPLQHFWPREKVQAFYAASLDWPIATVYLGETVCSKRRQLRHDDWLALADAQAAAGREVVLSTLALIEAASELSSARRWVDNGRFLVEANDMATVQLCREAGVHFVGGPSLNVYNQVALRHLVDAGMVRWVASTEMGRVLLQALIDAARADGMPMPALEVTGWGRLPLAWSARCFTARAFGTGKDDCGFRCIEHPDGLPLATRDGEPFLRINGIQVQGEAICDLAPELAELGALGASRVRLYPQVDGMAEVVARFSAALSGGSVARLGDNAGYWHGGAAMRRSDGTIGRVE